MDAYTRKIIDALGQAKAWCLDGGVVRPLAAAALLAGAIGSANPALAAGDGALPLPGLDAAKMAEVARNAPVVELADEHDAAPAP